MQADEKPRVVSEQVTIIMLCTLIHSIQCMVKQRPSLRCHSSTLVWASHLPHWHDTDRWKALQVQSSIDMFRLWCEPEHAKHTLTQVHGKGHRFTPRQHVSDESWGLLMPHTLISHAHPDPYTIHLQVYPTQTKYTFEQAGIQLNLTVSLHDIGHSYIHTMDC